MPYQVNNYSGTLVTLTEEQWRHIEKRHAAVRGPAINLTLRDPDKVALSSNTADRKAYFRLGADTRPAYRGLYCKVITADTQEGETVITAMYQWDDEQGADFQGGTLYVRPKK